MPGSRAAWNHQAGDLTHVGPVSTLAEPPRALPHIGHLGTAVRTSRGWANCLFVFQRKAHILEATLSEGLCIAVWSWRKG